MYFFCRLHDVSNNHHYKPADSISWSDPRVLAWIYSTVSVFYLSPWSLYRAQKIKRAIIYSFCPDTHTQSESNEITFPRDSGAREREEMHTVEMSARTAAGRRVATIEQFLRSLSFFCAFFLQVNNETSKTESLSKETSREDKRKEEGAVKDGEKRKEKMTQ